MKKLLLVCIMCLGVVAAHGATTCLHNRTGVFVLKKSQNGVSSSYSADDMTWRVTFGYDLVPNNSSYRTLTGNATCNEISTTTDGANAKKGDANVYLRASNADVGTMCWCSMYEPVSSWWVFMRAFDDEDACKSGCASACADAVKNDTDKFRSAGVYMAIW